MSKSKQIASFISYKKALISINCHQIESSDSENKNKGDGMRKTDYKRISTELTEKKFNEFVFPTWQVIGNY
ncbi:MAG: hypothetical protein CK430_14345 [Legionella sp.]|nr:MAG: hypothetical protein CK430_14345 [Legionella sp.]